MTGRQKVHGKDGKEGATDGRTGKENGAVGCV